MITSQFRSQTSWLRQIELFLRLALIELGYLGVGREGEDLGDGDGIEGYILGGEEGMLLLFGELGRELEESVRNRPETGNWIYWWRSNWVFFES